MLLAETEARSAVRVKLLDSCVLLIVYCVTADRSDLS